MPEPMPSHAAPDTSNTTSAKAAHAATRRRHMRLPQGWIPLVMFILVTLMEGGAFLYSAAPLTMPDPDLHVGTTYALATGQSFNHVETVHSADRGKIRLQILHGDSRYLNINQSGASNVLLDTELAGGASDETRFPAINPLALQGTKQYNEQNALLDSAERTEITRPYRSNQYLFVQYIPQAIGMTIGLHTNAKPSKTFLLARISNFICYLLLFALAIAIAPAGKGLLALMGVLPVPVFCASGLMPDGNLCASIALFVAVSMRLMQSSKRLNVAQLIALIAGASLVAMNKYVYAPIVLLPLFASRAMSRKQRAIYMGSTIAIVAPVTLWWQATHAYICELSPGLYEHNLKFFRAHMLKTVAGVTANVFITTFNCVRIDSVLVMTCIILLVAAVWSNGPRLMVSRNRVLALNATVAFIIFCVLFLTYFALFLTWTHMNTEVRMLAIGGMQNRYFYPLLPLLVIPFVYRYRLADTSTGTSTK